MMTREQLDRLHQAAPTAAAIVELDRQIEAMTDRVVTPFAAIDRVELRALLRDRRVVQTRAAQLWGHTARNDGTAHA